MNKNSVLYKFLKRVENPQNNTFYTFLNFYFCLFLSINGKRVKKRINKEYPGKTILLLPTRSAGDLLFLRYKFSEMLNAAGINQYVLCVASGGCYNAALTMNYDMVCPLSLIEQKSLLMYQRFNVYKGQMDIMDCYPWCMFDSKTAYKTGNDSASFDDLVEKTRFDNEELIEKSVILSPYENSMREHGLSVLPIKFWEELTSSLLNKGYSVYTNCVGNDNEPLIRGTKKIFPKFSEIEDCVSKSVCCVMIRSGFTDYAMSSKTPKIILYPNKSYYNSWSVTRTRNENNCEEIIYDEYVDDYSNLINRVSDYIDRKCSLIT